VQLRAGVLPTRCSRSRGRSQTPEDINCRLNCGPESLSHILQSCPATHLARCRRHNTLCTFLLKKLRRRQQTSILSEPHIPTQTSFIKPDIIILSGPIVYVVEAAICDPNRMANAYNDKQQKYGCPAAVNSIKEYFRS
jgi:hypothetical protein